METPLDKVLNAVEANPGLVDDYYTLFLNTELFIPVWSSEQAEEGEEVEPVVVEQEGFSYIPAFDTQERLKAWAQREIGMTGMRGYDLLRMIRPHGFLLALNEGTTYTKTFSHQEIDWLLDNAESAGK